MIFKIDIVANIGKASVAKIAIKIDMTRIQINKIRGIIIKTAKKTKKTHPNHTLIKVWLGRNNCLFLFLSVYFLASLSRASR